MSRFSYIKTFLILLLWGLPTGRLFALPKPLKRVLDLLEDKNKEKKKPKVHAEKSAAPDASTEEGKPNEAAPEPQPAPVETSPLDLAKAAIDEVIKDTKLANHPATWYYRGVIYHALLKNHITSPDASVLLDETLLSYTKAKALALPHTQFHSFAHSNTIALWNYYLNRGVQYYKQEAFKQAIDYFTICRRVLPAEAIPLLYMGMAYHASKEGNNAVECYRQYLDKTGPNVSVYRAIADVEYHQLKHIEAAIGCINQAWVKFPFENQLLEEKIAIYEAAGEISRYEMDLLAAIEGSKPMLPFCPKPTKKRALPLHHKLILGEDFYIKTRYTLPIAKKADQLEQLYAYAYLLEYQNRIEEARFFYEKMVNKRANQAHALRQLGFLWYKKAIETSSVAHQLIEQMKPSSQGYRLDGLNLILTTISPKFVLPLSFEIDHGQRITIYYQTLMEPIGFTPFHVHIQLEQFPSIGFFYGYILKKMANSMKHYRLHNTMILFKQQLNGTLRYIDLARKTDKQHPAMAQALYFTYYQLKKYRSAKRLSQAMEKRKQYICQSEDPFVVSNRQ
ncbi:MAG: hypothetical protein K2X94_03415 [Amoebophilaceae bacterium]|nr:hypothetical protein [Amoebophilaceae bacterium]